VRGRRGEMRKGVGKVRKGGGREGERGESLINSYGKEHAEIVVRRHPI
jgi:hypothetical protein